MTNSKSCLNQHLTFYQSLDTVCNCCPLAVNHPTYLYLEPYPSLLASKPTMSRLIQQTRNLLLHLSLWTTH